MNKKQETAMTAAAAVVVLFTALIDIQLAVVVGSILVFVWAMYELFGKDKSKKGKK